MARVSVIIPTYNRGTLLKRAVNSVLAQSFEDFELLIVDDASTDETESIVKEYHDSRVAYHRHSENRGASGARNTGLAHTSGEFVAFLDSDDEWVETKLAQQLAAFDRGSDRLGVVYTSFRKIAWHYEPALQRWDGDIADRILVRNFVGTASTPVIRRQCFESGVNFDETNSGAEDWDLWIRLAQKWEFEHIDDDLVLYYHQPVSLTSNRRGVLRACDLIFEKHDALIQNLPASIRAAHYLNRGRIYLTQREFAAGARALAHAFAIDPRVSPHIARYLFIETGRKLLDRARGGGTRENEA